MTLGLYTMLPPTDAARAAVRRMNPDAMLLLDNALPWAAELPDVYTIFRCYGLFPDNLTLPTTPDECFARGIEKGMALAYLVKFSGVKAVVGLNERHPANQYDAERIGAFEAGVASVVVPRGLDFVAFNWSVGYSHADRVAWAWAELRRRCIALYLDMEGIILGYHGYTKTGQDAGVDWMENRPEIFYCAEFNLQGIPWPEWGLTECGYDNGVQDANGWRHNIGEAADAAYLRRLPSLTPRAKFRCIFAWRCTDDWAAKGFEVEGAALVEQAITETNAEVTPMPETWDRSAIWASYQSRLSVFPAFEKYLAYHPELGGWIDAAEYDVGGIRLRGAAGGLVWARIGDWGNVRHATYLAQLPLAP